MGSVRFSAVNVYALASAEAILFRRQDVCPMIMFLPSARLEEYISTLAEELGLASLQTSQGWVLCVTFAVKAICSSPVKQVDLLTPLQHGRYQSVKGIHRKVTSPAYRDCWAHPWELGVESSTTPA